MSEYLRDIEARQEERWARLRDEIAKAREMVELGGRLMFLPVVSRTWDFCVMQGGRAIIVRLPFENLNKCFPCMTGGSAPEIARALGATEWEYVP